MSICLCQIIKKQCYLRSVKTIGRPSPFLWVLGILNSNSQFGTGTSCGWEIKKFQNSCSPRSFYVGKSHSICQLIYRPIVGDILIVGKHLGNTQSIYWSIVTRVSVDYRLRVGYKSMTKCSFIGGVPLLWVTNEVFVCDQDHASVFPYGRCSLTVGYKCSVCV